MIQKFSQPKFNWNSNSFYDFRKPFFVTCLFIFLLTGNVQAQVMTQGPEKISTGITACSKEQIILQSRFESADSYSWQVNTGEEWVELGTNKRQSYLLAENQEYTFKVLSELPDSTYQDSIIVTAMSCCLNPETGAQSSLQTIYYENFGTLTDLTGENFKVWDYETDPLHPVEKVVAADAPYRRKLDIAPIGTEFSNEGPLLNDKYTVAGYITNNLPYEGYAGALLEWSGMVNGPTTIPPISFDHSGTVLGGALFINNPLNSIGNVIYERDFTNLCITNKTILFECYISVFTTNINGVNVTVKLIGGVAPIEINGVASREGDAEGGRWVRIAGSIDIIGNTLKMEIINNAPNENNFNGNDLVIDDIKIMACVPPKSDLQINNQYEKSATFCEELNLTIPPSATLENYFENAVHLLQWSATPQSLTTWNNLDTSAGNLTPGIKNQLPDTIKEGDKIFFRTITGNEEVLNTPPSGGFNINDLCRNYSVSATIEAVYNCSPITYTFDSKEDKKNLIFPNPAKEIIYFGVNNVSFQILNGIGTTVMKGQASFANIGFLASGMYNVIITNEEGEVSTQLIIKE